MRLALANAFRPALPPGSAAASRLQRRTRALGVAAVGSVALLFGAEFARVWRLGKLPVEREDDGPGIAHHSRRSASQVMRIVREGYGVSSTRENAVFVMEVAFVSTFSVTRWITYSIRVHGGLGPIKNVRVGKRHIHHFVPGMLLALSAGAVSIASQREELDRFLAIPFGIGTALVLDESALLLELQDVYWSEQGVMSLQIAFTAASMLAAGAYAIRLIQRGEGRVLESDWETAAKAFDDLQMLRRS